MNNSSQVNVTKGANADLSDTFKAVHIVVGILIIGFTLFGNFLIISSIWRVKKLRQVFSSVLIINLAFCDIFLVLISIPTHAVIIYTSPYPFGHLGCKLINPISTYCVNTIAFTLTLISIERYLTIRYNFRSHASARSKALMVFIIHAVAMAIVIPYMVFSDLKTNQNNDASCEETWGIRMKNNYTIILFMVQFMIPLPILLALYTLSWRTIQKRNLKTIRTLDQLQSRSPPDCKKCCCCCCLFFSFIAFPSCQHRSQLRRKLSIASEVSIARQKQTKYYLKMFTAVVVLFTLCMMPNQITWLYVTPLNSYVEAVFYWLTYSNGVLNPWIYAGFNPYFKQAYRNFVKRFFSICLKEEMKSMKERRSNTVIFHHNTGTTPVTLIGLMRNETKSSGNDFFWDTPWNMADKQITNNDYGLFDPYFGEQGTVESPRIKIEPKHLPERNSYITDMLPWQRKHSQSYEVLIEGEEIINAQGEISITSNHSMHSNVSGENQSSNYTESNLAICSPSSTLYNDRENLLVNCIAENLKIIGYKNFYEMSETHC